MRRWFLANSQPAIAAVAPRVPPRKCGKKAKVWKNDTNPLASFPIASLRMREIHVLAITSHVAPPVTAPGIATVKGTGSKSTPANRPASEHALHWAGWLLALPDTILGSQGQILLPPLCPVRHEFLEANK